jgi:hypothetical protein
MSEQIETGLKKVRGMARASLDLVAAVVEHIERQINPLKVEPP